MSTQPPPSANQNGPGSPTADGRMWYTLPAGSNPSGYYIDPDPNQAAKDAAARAGKATANPYSGNGLLAVGSQIFMGQSPNMAAHVQADLLAAVHGDQNAYNQCINLNALADPTWNADCSHVVFQGKSPADVWKKSQGGTMHYTEAQLESGTAVLKTYLQYK